MTTKHTEQNDLIGCACRWDKDDNRSTTCERHQGWLDVVHEWAERAKAAEALLAEDKAGGEVVAWADKAMELATDFAVESLRLGDYETRQTLAGYDKWKINMVREKREAARDRLRQYLYTRPQPQTESVRVPEGYALVPVEPTDEMREAFHKAHDEWDSGLADPIGSPDHQWAAMLAAAPKPQEPGA